jgi:hypothetical protein
VASRLVSFRLNTKARIPTIATKYSKKSTKERMSLGTL